MFIKNRYYFFLNDNKLYKLIGHDPQEAAGFPTCDVNFRLVAFRGVDFNKRTVTEHSYS